MRWMRCPSKVGSCSSALWLCGANFSSAMASAVSTAASIVSRECCEKRGRFRSDSSSSTSKSWNSRSRRLTILEPMANSHLQPLLADGFVVAELVGGAVEDNPAVPHHVQPLRDLQRDGQLLLHHQTPPAPLLHPAEAPLT